MKNFWKPAYLPWAVLAAGAVGLLLRLWLFGAADVSGLLPIWHISEILLWILTAAVMLFLLCCTWNLRQATKYRFNFPASVPGGMGAWLGALGIGGTCIVELLINPDTMTAFTAVLGLIAAALLVFIGICRRNGRRPSMLFHGFLCIFMMIRLISQYRHWSADPQLQDYCFQIIALVCLMLSSYQRALFDANSGKRRPYAFFNLAAVYFCCLALPGWENTAFFLGCGVWMFADTCNLTPMNHKETPDAAS